MRWIEFVGDDTIDAPQSHAYGRIGRQTRGGVVQAETQGPSEDWAPPQLQRLDANGPGTLKLHRPWLSRGELWVLEQGWKPVGMIERAARRTALRTSSEEWAVEVRRRPRRLGWHLEFTRMGAGQPALQYHPRGLLPGGHLTVSGERRYRLRSSMLRATGGWQPCWEARSAGSSSGNASPPGTSACNSHSSMKLRTSRCYWSCSWPLARRF
jgi:hypothetical protein